MEDDAKTIVSVRHLHKSFKLPHDKNSTLKGRIVRPFAKRRYEKQYVLKGINFTIKKGEFFGIVGRNGSGKSTLLKLLAGIYSPDSGEVKVHGRLTPFIELGVGFNPELTGRENVYLNGALLGFSREDMDSMYAKIVEFAELERFMDQKLKNYSSGMQVRLAFSIAIRVESDVLLLDEVLAVGDAAFQQKCISYFKELKRKKQTVILVTHDMDVVRAFCDRGILLNEGKIVSEGDPEMIAREYLRLFSDNTVEQTAENKVRWGSKDAVYVEAKTTRNDGAYHLILKAQAANHIEKPSFGFLVKSEDGTAVLGTNTQIKNVQITALQAQQEVSLVWVIPDVFSNGKHTIDIAITSPNGTEVYDWWEGATQFQVKGKDKTPYLISPELKVSVVDAIVSSR